MMTTPLAARLPYNAAEAASFKMDMLSISLEFSSAMFPSKGTPSTTYRGSEAPETNVPKPRIRMLGAEPVSPYVLFTCTPGAAPSSAPVTLVVMRFSIFLLSTTEIEPVNDSFLAVPYATTTTSSKASALLLIVTFTLGLIATSCVCIPIYEITKVFAELQ